MSAGPVSGGCQCGAVRFRAQSLGRSSICHCRMCQKAFGSFFGPLVTAVGLEWTRGEPKRYRSSNVALRGFCADCGTPLTYEYAEGVEVATGALDEPGVAPPVIQVNVTDRLPFFAELARLPERSEADEARNRERLASVENYQHPDHDVQDPDEASQANR